MHHLNNFFSMSIALASAINTGTSYACHRNPNVTQLTQPFYPLTDDCQEYMIPVTISSDNFVFNFTHWDDDYALKDFLTAVTTRPTVGFPGITIDTVNEEATNEIAASLCTPKRPNGKEKTVILATHGTGPAKTHWNLPYIPEEYNFVQWAIAQGYSVIFYDRLGCGESQKVSGYTNQIIKQAAILGDFTGGLTPQKLILIGFSFGSYTTHAAIASKPSIADSVILTGINTNGLARSFVPRIASKQNLTRFGALDSGYLIWVDRFSQITSYFKRHFYDAAAVDFIEHRKEAFGVGEFLTFPALASLSAADYTGPVLHITGESDYIVCDGHCPGIFDEPAKTLYKNAKLTRYLHPGASHNFNFHHNATGAYKVITDFLADSGL